MYAVKIPIDSEWVYAVHVEYNNRTFSDEPDNVSVKTFKTLEEAKKFASIWKKHKIVEYK